ncbi:ATP-binding protein [Candidatus Margulisiibacteriota bacterium]
MSPNRKVLIIKGARQVGKTYSVRRFGSEFKYFIEVNFEEEKDVLKFFNHSLNPHRIIEKLSAFYSTPIKPGETLLFFDEIQSCPNALSSLRFFYEKIPGLHVIAAGSLLEFALTKIPSHAVGRLNYLYHSPMTFEEFLIVMGEGQLLNLLVQHNPSTMFDDVFHRKLLNYFKTYQVIGGMPAVVESYIEHRDLLLCQQILDDLITSFQDDFAKYKKHSPVLRLQEVFYSIMQQAGNKFKYSNIESSSTPPMLKAALDLLIKAGLAYKIYHTSAQGIPLGAQIKPNKFKVISFDIGIHQRMLGLDLSKYIVADSFDQISRACLCYSVGLCAPRRRFGWIWRCRNIGKVSYRLSLIVCR